MTTSGTSCLEKQTIMIECYWKAVMEYWSLFWW